VLFASDRIEHDGDLRDLPLIDRKRRLAKLIGKAKRRARHARQTNCISQKLESAEYAWRSQRERPRKTAS
jgi:ATP-dependent DNA ligase